MRTNSQPRRSVAVTAINFGLKSLFLTFTLNEPYEYVFLSSL